MALVQWSDGFLTGDATVDDQHRELFRLFNNLHEAITAQRDREHVVVLLDAVVNSIASHFQTEERLMLLHGYPGYAMHKTKHDDLRQSSAKVIDDYRSGRALLTIGLSRFLADWLRHHIDGEDRGMIRYFQARKLTPTVASTTT